MKLILFILKPQFSAYIGRMKRYIAALILTLIPGLAWAAAPSLPAMRPITVEYDIYVGGLHLLHAKAHADLDAKTYRLAARAQTIGIWEKWFPWETTVESVGHTAAGGKIKPSHYKTVSAWKHNPKSMLLDYQDGGKVMIAEESTDAPDLHDRLSDDIVNQTLDPLSGLLQLLAHYTVHNDCNAQTAVFDGRRRFDLAADDLGAVTIPADPDTGVFSGAARKCALRFNLIAGKAKEMESRKFWQTAKGKDNRPPFTVWLGRLQPGMPSLPVRAETSSPFGLVMIYLTAWRFDDAPVAPELTRRMAKAKLR